MCDLVIRCTSVSQILYFAVQQKITKCVNMWVMAVKPAET